MRACVRAINPAPPLLTSLRIHHPYKEIIKEMIIITRIQLLLEADLEVTVIEEEKTEKMILWLREEALKGKIVILCL